MNDYIVTIDEEKFSVDTGNKNSVKLNGSEHKIEISKLSEHTYQVLLDNNIFHITTNKLESNKYSFLIDGHYFESIVRTKLEEKAAEILDSSKSKNDSYEIKSPMPGLILRIDKEKGDKVEKGESLILLEAMKMENEIRAPIDGIIEEVYIEEGVSVEKNQPLIIVKQ